MFILTTVVYPCLLEILCVGAGLLVDRLCGRYIPAVLLPALGAALLIALSQLATETSTTAPATPYIFVAVGLAGIALEWRRIVTAARRPRSRRWQLWLPAIVYCLALAPVLAFGQTTFTAYNVLPDSAFHMAGADFLIRHGRDFAHLDLRNSYGQYIAQYYATSYPSGADTLFGGSSFVLGLPLIWTFQPYNAFMLAITAGPAWLLARRTGLGGAWAALAALTATIPALVYGYGLIGSIKEVSALPFVLTLGALVVMHERWLSGPSRRAVPFALVAAAGVSVLGVGFGAWILACVLALAAVAAGEIAAGRRRAGQVLTLGAIGVVVAALAAVPTWRSLSASLQGTQAIASTTNAGNLATPLKVVQVFGTWLSGLYTSSPQGTAALLTYIVIVVTAIAALVGVHNLWRNREDVLGGWIVALLVLALAALAFATTWIDAKTLMLSSPIVLLLAWGGVAAVLQARNVPVAALIAIVVTAGVIASDVMQYRATALAPPARYGELAAIDARFAGRGPALFTDWDEYALYVLRDLDVGGPDFRYPPPALAHLVPTHSAPVHLDAISPGKLRAYPLIITRVDPIASRPPYAYQLAWHGQYYDVWVRRPHTAAALAHLGLYANAPVGCERVAALATRAERRGGYLVAAYAPEIVRVDIKNPSPRSAYVDGQLELTATARGVGVRFEVPHGGAWYLWLRGEIMPAVAVRVDGRVVARVSDELAGNDFNPDTIGPLHVRLSAGAHRLTFASATSALAPGASGEASLGRIFLTTPAGALQERLRLLPANAWQSLCGGRYDWIEAVPR
jgi:hypothetical protein